MSPPSHDRSELKQRQQELSRQLADTLLSEDSPIKETSSYQQDWQQHQALRERQQSLALLDSKLLEVLPGIEQRERQVGEAKKAVAQEVKALRQFAAELGKIAFAAVVSGDVVATDRFEARKTLHDHLEKLSHEKDALGQDDAAKLTEKVKLKARQLKMAGEIKMGQLKIGSLDRTLGESLLNEKEEASVDCPQTREVLEAITGQRTAIATATEKQASAQSQLADTLVETAQTLDRESVEGATVLQAELKQVRKDARSIEPSIAASRAAIVAKALKDESLRDNEQLGPNLKQLWSTQFESKSKSAPSADDLGRQAKILVMECEQFIKGHPKVDSVSLASQQCPHCGNKVNSGYDTCGTCNKDDLVWISVDLKYYQREPFTVAHEYCDFRQKQWSGPCIKGTKGLHQEYFNLVAAAENKNREWKIKLRDSKCFVATACFRDEQHPTVLGLRRFRDQVLQDRSLGRSFIAWYYRNGPGLANTLDYIPWIYPLLRVTLSLGLKVLQLRYAKIR